jgi:HNH endonuclease
MRRATPETFWGKVDKAFDCWMWRGAHFNSGYARVKFHGRDTVAHLIAWELTNGPVPAGLELDHLCRNRGCVNPAHLEPVTHRENEVRGNTVIRNNALKIVCHKGHPLSGDNLFVRNDGRRRCRACERATQKKLRSTSNYKRNHAADEPNRRAERKLSQ